MNYERATMFLLKERPLPPEKTTMTSEKAIMTSKKAAKAVRISLTAPLPHQINQINFHPIFIHCNNHCQICKDSHL
jgi:hypothetical protein